MQLEAERAFVDGWRRHGLDVDLASLTYPGQYHYVPEYLAAHGWETVQRNVAELLGAMGLARRLRPHRVRPRIRHRDTALIREVPPIAASSRHPWTVENFRKLMFN